MKQNKQDIYEVISGLGIEEKLNLYEILKDAIDAELNIADAEDDKPVCPIADPRSLSKAASKAVCSAISANPVGSSFARPPRASLDKANFQRKCGTAMPGVWSTD